MATEKNEILGIPYINGNSLMQDVILLYTLDGKKVNETSSNVILIKDIWKDLKTNEVGSRNLEVSGEYSVELKASGPKNSNKKFWFYRIKYTNMDPENPKKFAFFDLPLPTPNPHVFEFDFEPNESDTEWAKYWRGVMKASEDSLINSTNALGSVGVPVKTKYMEYQKDDGTFSGEVMPLDSGLWERENPYDSMGGLLASFW